MPKGIVTCEKCSQYYESQKKDLPCKNYEEGDEFLFYDDTKHDLCYNLKQPYLPPDLHEAFNLWEILSDDRAIGMAASTIRTESILMLCLAIGETWEMFLNIKAIERVYYNKMNSDRNESSNSPEVSQVKPTKSPPKRPRKR